MKPDNTTKLCVCAAGFKMKKRVGDVEEFEFEPLSEGRQLHITIAVSGWLTEDNPGLWLGKMSTS